MTEITIGPSCGAILEEKLKEILTVIHERCDVSIRAYYTHTPRIIQALRNKGISYNWSPSTKLDPFDTLTIL